MHFHPTTNGSPSTSSEDGVPLQASDLSTPHHSEPLPSHSGYDVSKKTTLPSKSSVNFASSRGANDIPPNWVEQLQLALAIANPELLQQLILHCQSPLIAFHQLGAINAAVSVPVEGTTAADSVLNVEVISCQLSPESSSTSPFGATVPPSTSPTMRNTTQSESPSAAIAQHRALVNQICRETKLQTLGMNIPLPDAIALLQYATFSLPDIQRILNLPYNGWHRSWWSMVDPSIDQALSFPESAGFSIPFKRLIRSRRYADGTVMLQYKDQFAHMPPPCFRTEQKSVLVHLQRPHQGISEILAWMNHARSTIQADYGLLLYHQLSLIEQQALINQGIHLYHCPGSPVATPVTRSPSPVLLSDSEKSVLHSIDTSHPKLVFSGDRVLNPESPATIRSDSGTPTVTSKTSNTLADCKACIQSQCPMFGTVDSPVITCRSFCPSEGGG